MLDVVSVVLLLFLEHLAVSRALLAELVEVLKDSRLLGFGKRARRKRRRTRRLGQLLALLLFLDLSPQLQLALDFSLDFEPEAFVKGEVGRLFPLLFPLEVVLVGLHLPPALHAERRRTELLCFLLLSAEQSSARAHGLPSGGRGCFLFPQEGRDVFVVGKRWSFLLFYLQLRPLHRALAAVAGRRLRALLELHLLRPVRRLPDVYRLVVAL